MLLKRRTAAKQALLHAETDNKLRRAMLRKYQGTNLPLEVGQLCFFWRDAKAADLVKIRWHGPARVVAREDKDGNPDVYWIAWKTEDPTTSLQSPSCPIGLHLCQHPGC